ncbi:nucleotidyltransferase domain-containing protein [Geotalea sp. SG265]|uniref:nucleotidyltransferase domain-containing protein n=1 Tax=Geotalea sp. SG265 TaxID=2922867 RepID=UPI001FB031BA|nr:nucleotidyltransferase domain-containing protein [Geotalea sp. SG265]
MTSETSERFGLKESTINRINSVFVKYSGIDRVLLYGSRAKGNYYHGSDIDLTIEGTLSRPEILKLENELDDLLLPYTIDLSLFHQISNPDLVEHIKRVGKVFYEKADGQ